MEWKHPHLIQRLQPPHKGQTPIIEWPAFGAGGHGGFSDEARALLKKLWRFDYMGAAEFEFGAVPEALHKLANSRTDLVRGSLVQSVTADVDRRTRKSTDTTPREPPRKVEATVYFICRKEHVGDLTSMIRILLKDNYPKDMYFKERVSIRNVVLKPAEEHYPDYVGWLGLDPAFLFFTDKEMFDNACNLFGVTTGMVTA